MSGTEPMLKAAGLWAKTSNSGKRYLTSPDYSRRRAATQEGGGCSANP
jgi:hypothetical protein